VFVPFFLVYRKTAVPYFLALIQHALIGDYLTGQVWLLWPFGQDYSLGTPKLVGITSPFNIGLEWTVFVLSLVIMFRTDDLLNFFRQQKWNLALAIPTFTVLLPTFLSVPLEVPVWLILPHVALTLLFFASILVSVRHLLRHDRG
jgi:heme A synthase